MKVRVNAGMLACFFLMMPLLSNEVATSSSGQLVLASKAVDDACMALWMKIDVARAIALTPEQKKAYIDDIAKDVLWLYGLIIPVGCNEETTPDKRDFMKELSLSLGTIKESIKELFKHTNPTSYYGSLFLLNKLIHWPNC